MPRRFKKKAVKRKVVRRPRNRLNVARIPRPLTLKSRSAVQKLVYYNTILCNPKNNSTTGAQQNYNFVIQLNSPWIFPHGYANNVLETAQEFAPNQAIEAQGVDGAIATSTTSMPGFQDGFKLNEQYAKGCVTGTKVTIQYTPLQNEDDNQAGILYAVKHSQPSSGLGLTSNINDLQKMPYRRMKRIAGAAAPTSGFTVNNIVSSRLVIKHSPKRFNNVKDLRDNSNLFFHP